MTPINVVFFFSRFLGAGRNPGVVGLVAFLSGLFAVPTLAAEVVEVHTALAAPAQNVGALLAPYMPVIIAAIMGGGTAFAAWLLKTVLGVGIEGFCTFAEAWADARLDAAMKDKDPGNDAPAMAFTKAVKSMCAKLRAAEKTLPDAGNKE